MLRGQHETNLYHNVILNQCNHSRYTMKQYTIKLTTVLLVITIAIPSGFAGAWLNNNYIHNTLAEVTNFAPVDYGFIDQPIKPQHYKGM